MNAYDIKFRGTLYDVAAGQTEEILNSVIRIGSLEECRLYLKNAMNEFSDKLIFNNDFGEPEYYTALEMLGDGSVHCGIGDNRYSYYSHYRVIETPIHCDYSKSI